MEQVGHDPLTIHSSVHTKVDNPTSSVTVNDATTNFKIYTLQWFVNKIEMYVGDDNNPFQTRILVWNKQGDWTTWPFDQPFFVLLNVAVGGTWGGAEGIDESIFPRQMEIDWVYYYQWQ